MDENYIFFFSKLAQWNSLKCSYRMLHIYVFNACKRLYHSKLPLTYNFRVKSSTFVDFISYKRKHLNFFSKLAQWNSLKCSYHMLYIYMSLYLQKIVSFKTLSHLWSYCEIVNIVWLKLMDENFIFFSQNWLSEIP